MHLKLFFNLLIVVFFILYIHDLRKRLSQLNCRSTFAHLLYLSTHFIIVTSSLRLTMSVVPSYKLI